MPEFYTDLLKAQKQIEAVSKDGVNPFFKSDYTTLNATILACKETLNANNIIVLQPIESDENGVYVSTTLIHTSGERLTSKMRITAVKSNDPQAQGSAITYARRYALKAMLCMSDSDDDAEKAMARKPEVKKQEVQKPADNRIPDDIRNTNFASDKQIGLISKMIKNGQLDSKIADEIPSMTKQRASELISSVYGK